MNKKIVIPIMILIFIFITTLGAIKFKNNNTSWVYIDENIYFNSNSLQRQENNNWCGWFREYGQSKGEYEEIKYCATCNNDKILNMAHYKKYENNTLIKDEIDNYSVTGQFDAYSNGELYYNSICGNKKN